MSEYKFRAWNKKTKKMFYPKPGMDERLVLQLNGTLGLFDDKMKQYDVTEDFELMQYTGLDDSEGKEIYEGDIITDVLAKLYAVEKNEDTCKWQLSDGTDLNDNGNYGTYKRVVGNIHDHPSLEVQAK